MDGVAADGGVPALLGVIVAGVVDAAGVGEDGDCVVAVGVLHGETDAAEDGGVALG